MVSRSGELLVVSNDGLVDTSVLDRVIERAQELNADVCLVVPCPVDELDENDNLFSQRARTAAEYLGERGVYADWILASRDPVAAVGEAMNMADGREIMIATRPVADSGWLHDDVVERARRYGLPVIHVVADVPAEARWDAILATGYAAA